MREAVEMFCGNRAARVESDDKSLFRMDNEGGLAHVDMHMPWIYGAAPQCLRPPMEDGTNPDW
jgi:hypothetical protein